MLLGHKVGHDAAHSMADPGVFMVAIETIWGQLSYSYSQCRAVGVGVAGAMAATPKFGGKKWRQTQDCTRNGSQKVWNLKFSWRRMPPDPPSSCTCFITQCLCLGQSSSTPLPAAPIKNCFPLAYSVNKIIILILFIHSHCKQLFYEQCALVSNRD